MYKTIKIKKVHLTFNKFKKGAKILSRVYRSGIRIFNHTDSYNFSIVVFTFRLILSIDKKQIGCSNG